MIVFKVLGDPSSIICCPLGVPVGRNVAGVQQSKYQESDIRSEWAGYLHPYEVSDGSNTISINWGAA